jgi:hypothetical protein
MLVKDRVSLDVPAFAVVQHIPILETVTFSPLISPSLEPQQYSAPELYTLHSSLLI